MAKKLKASGSRLGIRNGLFSLAFLLVVAGLLFGGAQPVAVGLFPPPMDKLVHATFFFGLALIREAGFIMPPWLIALTAMVIGMADEILQKWLPGRTASLAD